MEAFIWIYLGELVFRLDFRLEQRAKSTRPGPEESGQVLVCNPGPALSSSLSIKDRSR